MLLCGVFQYIDMDILFKRIFVSKGRMKIEIEDTMQWMDTQKPKFIRNYTTRPTDG